MYLFSQSLPLRLSDLFIACPKYHLWPQFAVANAFALKYFCFETLSANATWDAATALGMLWIGQNRGRLLNQSFRELPGR